MKNLSNINEAQDIVTKEYVDDGLSSKSDSSHSHADLHTHTNKSTLDKFTEVDNKPYYNGAEIGGAIPNLTLNELTLGGRFKIVYNDIEDSLDIEVI